MTIVYAVEDVTAWPRIGVEQMGTKRKFWCRHPRGPLCLFKFSRAQAGEAWSEKIASEVAAALGLPHAEIELATCEGERGTSSVDFTNGKAYGGLIHGNELLLELDPHYPKHGQNFRVAQHTLDRIFKVLSQPFIGIPEGFAGPSSIASACDLFVGYLLLDALITNTDRHHENWAILLQPTVDGSRRAVLAPTFDHASSLGRELPDGRRIEKLRPLRRDQTIIGYLENDAGRSRIFASEHDAKALHPMDVFRKAIQRYPQAGESWLDRLSSDRRQCAPRLHVAACPRLLSQAPGTQS
jgi:hypothetical protein